ncbi:MAG TPA: glycosyltransferase family 39 protein, partial [Planctomycetota bacterium]|nr:glycosyltransferase family 39 protein [Planctomycetota bacterium]
MSDAGRTGWLFAAAFLIRLIAWMGAGIFGTDSCHYLLMADWLREGRFSDALSIPYHPFYPLLTAVASLPFGHSAAAGALVSILLGSAAVLPLHGLVRSVFGRPEAFIAGLLYAFNPSIIEVQSDVMTEGTFLFFFVGSIWLAWRQLEEPTVARAVTLGAGAAAAFLTRPEGLLAVAFGVGWPIAAAVVRSGRRGLLLGGAGISLAVVLVLVFPYLAWIRSSKGHWDLSMRPSVGSAVRSAGLLLGPVPEGEPLAGASMVGVFKSLVRLTYLVTIPFYLVGIVALRKRRAAPVVFLLSYPLAYLGAVMITLRVHDFLSPRYLIPVMTLATGIAALGVTTTLRWGLARPALAGRVALAGPALVLAVAVLPCVKVFTLNRWECRSYRDAARWIEERGRPRALSGPVQQVAYLTGCRSVYSAMTPEGVREQVARDH